MAPAAIFIVPQRSGAVVTEMISYECSSRERTTLFAYAAPYAVDFCA